MLPLLSPFTTEVLSSATSLVDFVNLINLCVLTYLYGLGLLLLGLAYGIIEKRVAVKSFLTHTR